jgi:hypothetical protein
MRIWFALSTVFPWFVPLAGRDDDVPAAPVDPGDSAPPVGGRAAVHAAAVCASPDGRARMARFVDTSPAGSSPHREVLTVDPTTGEVVVDPVVVPAVGRPRRSGDDALLATEAGVFRVASR